MSDYVCPGCLSHDMAEDCFHSERDWELAEAMRDGVERLHPGPPQWTPLEGAWNFADDAQAVSDVVGDGPYRVEYSHPRNAQYDTIGLVNGRWLIGSTDDVADYIGDISELLAAVTEKGVDRR